MSCDMKQVCKDIRSDVVSCIGHLGVGHIGGCLSVVELLGVLYFDDININQKLVDEKYCKVYEYKEK